MTFRIELIVQDELPAARHTADVDMPRDESLSAHDALVHVLSAQCRALARTGAVSFRVGGFGQDRWPVDVQTDLAVALEQVPAVLLGIRESEPFQFNFYEQGIERYLTGTRQNDDVLFECMSLSTRWSPDPAVETVDVRDAQRMFQVLRETYLAAVEHVCPWSARIPAFERWRSCPEVASY